MRSRCPMGKSRSVRSSTRARTGIARPGSRPRSRPGRAGPCTPVSSGARQRATTLHVTWSCLPVVRGCFFDPLLPMIAPHGDGEHAVQCDRRDEPLVDGMLDRFRQMRYRLRAEVGQPEAGELHTARREIEHLRAAGVELTVYLVLVAFRLVLETAVRLGEQVVARPVYHCMARADLDARGDAAFRNAMRAQLTLHDLRERLVPLELRHAIRARDLAVAAADALRAVPRDDAVLALLERADHARGH